MKQFMVFLVLILYVAFSFNPLTELVIFSRTLFLSPGEMMTVLLVVGIVLNTLISGKRPVIGQRPPAVNHFLLSYLFMAAVFLIPTLLFFLIRNELADNLPRSLLWYSRWLIALILFYVGSDSELKFEDVRLVLWVLMGTFILAVFGNLGSGPGDSSVAGMIARTFESQYLRLEGQFPDPNQLGVIAVLFTVIGLMGALHEEKAGYRLLFAALALGTSIIMMLTQSREAILTLLVALLGTTGLLVRKREYGKGLVVLAGLIFGSALIVVNIPRVAETLMAVDVGNATYALNARDETWRAAWDVIATNPFGIGFENLSYITADLYWQAHNAFLQSAVVAGIFGFAAYLYFLVSLFLLLRAQENDCRGNWMMEACTVFLAGYVATSMVSDHFITFFIFNAIFFGLLGISCRARVDDAARMPELERLS